MTIISNNRFRPERLSTLAIRVCGGNPSNGTLPANNASIATIKNSGRTSISCSQGNPPNQASFIANAYNNKGILRCAGGQFYNLSGFTFGSSFTAFAVYTPSTVASYIAGNNPAGAFVSKLDFGSGVKNYGFYHVNGGTDQIALSTSAVGLNVCEVTQIDSSSVTGLFNGASIFSGAPTANSSGSVLDYLFSFGGTSNFFNGDFGDYLVFSPALSAADARDIRHYLGDFWGVTVT